MPILGGINFLQLDVRAWMPSLGKYLLSIPVFLLRNQPSTLKFPLVFSFNRIRENVGKLLSMSFIQ